MKPHKHSELIKLWADGAEIERWSNKPNCHQVQVQGYMPRWVKESTPQWIEREKYRIKPEPKPESIKGNMYIYNNPSEGKTWISPTKLPYADSIYCQYIGKIEVIK